MSNTDNVPKALAKHAGSLLNTINKGVINIPEIKGFLAKVEQTASPRKKTKREERMEQIRTSLK